MEDYIIELPDKPPENDEDFMTLVKLIAKAGAIVQLTYSYADYEKVFLLEDGSSFYLGDCNCPHQKEYDIRDGHGLTTISVKDYEDGDTAYSQLWDMVVRLKKKQETLKGTEPIKRV